MNEEMLLGIGVILFTLLFIPILKTVKYMPLFKENPVITALVITALCIVALYEVLVAPPSQKNTDNKRPDFLFILIPYATLALSILAILLLRFLNKIPLSNCLRNVKVRTAIKKCWHYIFSMESPLASKSQDSDNITKEKKLP